MIRFTCRHCSERLSVPDILGGKEIRCPECDAPLRIPSAFSLVRCSLLFLGITLVTILAAIALWWVTVGKF
jgi:hypothetical protein